ncbi:MAG: alpha/beta hydrolase [Lachnospiraceae bacterium]|nr:alpha/beta hydrolase [Lachnospiraceae bacterium]
MKAGKKALKYIAFALVFLCIAGGVAFKAYTSNFYREDEKLTAEFASEVGDLVHAYSDDYGMVFIPTNHNYQAIIVFYPGGKVEFSAYSGLMYELASRGYLCLLPRMPENLAFLEVNAVEGIKARYPEEAEETEALDWYLAGHSLGGVAASSYLGDHMDEYAGLIMCASYTTTDLSNSNLRMLSTYGSLDGVLNMDKYEDSKALWPQDATEKVIQGGNHSYFGCYGVQRSDGKPQITNKEQVCETADLIDAWIREK